MCECPQWLFDSAVLVYERIAKNYSGELLKIKTKEFAETRCNNKLYKHAEYLEDLTKKLLESQCFS